MVRVSCTQVTRSMGIKAKEKFIRAAILALAAGGAMDRHRLSYKKQIEVVTLDAEPTVLRFLFQMLHLSKSNAVNQVNIFHLYTLRNLIIPFL